MPEKPLFLPCPQAYTNALCLNPGVPFSFQHFTEESLGESLHRWAQLQSTDPVNLSCLLMDARSLPKRTAMEILKVNFPPPQTCY